MYSYDIRATCRCGEEIVGLYTSDMDVVWVHKRGPGRGPIPPSEDYRCSDGSKAKPEEGTVRGDQDLSYLGF